jgi:hypothetical protein
MSHLHFTAWGTVDIEKLERLERRRFIREIRKVCGEHGLVFHSGGQQSNLTYSLWREGNAKLLLASSRNCAEVCAVAIKIMENLDEQPR